MSRWHERRAGWGGPPWHDGSWRGRRFFLARVAVVFAALLGFSVYGVVALLSAVIPRLLGRGGSPADGPIAGVVWPLAFLVVLVLLVSLSMRRFGRPLNDVVAAAERVGQGDMAVRVREFGPPWLRSVAAAFNSMAARLETQQRQRRDLMADVAHELRTPLAAMQGRLEALQDGVYPLDAKQVGELLDDTRTLGRLVDDLRTLAHSEAGTLALVREPTDVAALLADVLESFRWQSDGRGAAIGLNAPPDLPAIDADPVRLREVAANLIANARQHSPADGRVTVEVSGAESAVTIRVHNDAVIPADELPRVFDRFYKGARSRGSGLGLTIARNLVAAHGGTIEVDSAPGRGTTFTVVLPAGASQGE